VSINGIVYLRPWHSQNSDNKKVSSHSSGKIITIITRHSLSGITVQPA